MSTTPILKFLFSMEWNVLNEALKLPPDYEPLSAMSANEVVELLKDKPSCLILISIRSKNDLVQLARLVKNLKMFRECVTKIIVINFSGNIQFEKALDKLGIQDIIEIKINTKVLKFKIDFWTKALNVQIKNNTAIKEAKTLKSLENSGTNNSDKQTPDHFPVWEEPIDCENDIWLLKNDSDAKKILTRWLIKILGPGPYIGSWNEVPSRAGMWKFDIKPEARDEFMSAEGDWYFKGEQKPDFIWKENTWLITGSAFELFYQGNDFIQSRFKLEGRTLKIARNSDFAKTKEQIILDSFDKDMLFKKEALNLGGAEGVNGHETEKLKNLSGKGKTDQISQKDLSGKGSTDQITQKNLSGKSNTSKISNDPMSMELKNDEGDVGGKQLSQKTTTSKTSSKMSGKNSKEEELFDDNSFVASDKHRDGELLGVENKNQEHEIYMRGHNEAEKFEASDKLGKKGKKTPLESAEDMSGKSSTDKIQSHMGRPQTEKEAMASAEAKDPLDGKSSTDKIDSHMGGHKNSREEAVKNPAEGQEKNSYPRRAKERAEREKGLTPEAKERAEREKGLTPEAKERADREKGLTPEAKERAEREKGLAPEVKNPLSGKSNTDKIDGHMGSGSGQKSASVEAKKKDLEILEEVEALDPKARAQKEAQAKKAKGTSDQEEQDSGKVNGRFKDQVQTGQAKSEFDNTGVKESASLYSLAKAREEKLKNNNDSNDEDEEIRRATEDPKVESVLTQNEKRFSCSLDDFFDGKIIFTTPDDGLKKAANINLDLSFKYMKKDTKLALVAAIETVEKDQDGNSFVTVELSQENIKSFEAFMKLYQDRQNNVDFFMKKAKGF